MLLLGSFQEHFYMFIMFHLVFPCNGNSVKVQECIDDVLFVNKFIDSQLEYCNPICYPKQYSGKLV